MATVTIAAGSTVTLDSGVTDNSVFVTNTGTEDAFLHPGAKRLRPGQSYTYTISPGVAVTATSRNGSSLSYSAGSEAQPGNSTLAKYTTGTLAAQPTAAGYGAGIYFAADDNGGTIYRSDGSSWAKQAPGVSQAATPSLVAGPAKITANFTTTSTSDVDVTGLSITFTAVAGASYWIWLKGAVGNTTSLASGAFSLTDSANTVLDTATYQAKAANDNNVTVLAAVVTPGAGSVTYKARLHASANTAFVLAGATFPGQIQAMRVA